MHFYFHPSHAHLFPGPPPDIGIPTATQLHFVSQDQECFWVGQKRYSQSKISPTVSIFQKIISFVNHRPGYPWPTCISSERFPEKKIMQKKESAGRKEPDAAPESSFEKKRVPYRSKYYETHWILDFMWLEKWGEGGPMQR